MNTRILIAALLALPLFACGGAAPVAEVTDDADTGGSEVITSEAADLEADADIKADRATLTSAQQKTVLKAIDDICGDTWCEGDFNYRFKRMSCDFGAKRCTLSADVLTYDDPPKTYPRACRITGVANYAAMVQTTNGYTSLKDTFYNKVSTCIDKWTPTIPQ